jgi:hypothetical protein
VYSYPGGCLKPQWVPPPAVCRRAAAGYFLRLHNGGFPTELGLDSGVELGNRYSDAFLAKHPLQLSPLCCVLLTKCSSENWLPVQSNSLAFNSDAEMFGWGLRVD